MSLFSCISDFFSGQFSRLLLTGLLPVGAAFAQNPLPPEIASASGVLQPFEVADPHHPFQGLLRRSANAGLDWYFTSLALVIAPAQARASHRVHFEKALLQVPIPGPLPVNIRRGFRTVSDSAQLWELTDTAGWHMGWDCARSSFPKGAPLAWQITDACGRTWRNWGRVAPDAFWTLTDTTDDFQALRQPDAHDSQTALFALAVARFVTDGQLWDWLREPLWLFAETDSGMPPGAAAGPRDVLTRADILQHMVRHNLLNHMQDGLFRTFRHNRHPEAGQWDVQYLMDNLECQAALRELAPFFDAAGYPAFAEVLRHYERELDTALQTLRPTHPAAPPHVYRWARQGEWPVDDPVPAFYPHIAAQYWAALFQVPSVGTLERQWTQMEPHLGFYSDWWRHASLHLDAGLPVYLARLQHMRGSAADSPPALLQHAATRTPGNSVISDVVAAWQIVQLLHQGNRGTSAR